MLIVYTGDGKGKTSASVGQAVRAAGQGLRVAFVQFMKKDVQAGEQRLLAGLPGVRLHIGGSGFFRQENERSVHRAAAQETLAWALEAVPTSDMLVLDEVLYALKKNLLTREELENLLEAADGQTHVVLSGRGLPDWLEERADLITELLEIKHPIHKGVSAVKGIEF